MDSGRFFRPESTSQSFSKEAKYGKEPVVLDDDE